MVGFLFVPRYA
jgi:hypothetical protein